MAATQDTRTFRISSTLGADVLLFHRMAGNDGLSVLGEYRVELLSEKADIAIDDVLGKALSLEVDAGSNVQRQFNGIVTRFDVAGRVGRYARYFAVVRPWLWLTTRQSDCRIFQDQDALTIIKTILSKYALADFDLRQVSASLPTLPYCVQYRETDFAFISRLMERFGIYYYFRHAGGRHTLVLADSGAAHDPIAGSARLHFDSEEQAGARETVYAWQAGGEIVSDVHTLQAYHFETPKVDLTARSVHAYQYGGDTRELELYDYPGGYSTRGAGEAEAKIRVESSGAGQRSVSARTTAAALAPGGLFTLADHPRMDQDGEMLAVAAEYALYADRFEAEPGMPKVERDQRPVSFDCAFTAIPKGAVFRAPRTTRAPLMHGPQTAVVVGKSGEEIWTDQYGRVRVKFHWDRLGDPDSTPDACSCWVRVAQAWAGKRFGQLVTPRIGQEVVVSFLEGDPDQPLVTGAVYNAQNMPPVTLPNDATQSTFKTSSSKGGDGFNELRFEDKKGKEEIFVQAEKDFNRVVKNNDTLKVGFDKKDKGDQTIDIAHDQALDVGNDQAVKVGNDQAVKVGNTIVIEAGTSIELKVGGSSIKIEAEKITIKSAEVEIAADANAKLKAGAMMEIKAGGVMTIGGALVQIN